MSDPAYSGFTEWRVWLYQRLPHLDDTTLETLKQDLYQTIERIEEEEAKRKNPIEEVE